MKKKISFLLMLSMMLFFSSISSAVEELRLISYYPSPFGAYSLLYVGRGTQLRERPTAGNTTTLMRIGVTNVDMLPGDRYVPARLEIGGIASMPGTETRPANIGLYCRGEYGILAQSTGAFPSVAGISTWDFVTGRFVGDGILGGGNTGVIGQGFERGVVGNAASSFAIVGVQGEVQASTTAIGVIGSNNADMVWPLILPITGQYIGILGRGGRVDVDPTPNGIGVLGEGRKVGVAGMSNGGLPSGWTSDNLAIGVYGSSKSYGVYGHSNSASGYAGYFEGNVQITGRTTLDRPNIPRVAGTGTVTDPQDGDMVFDTTESCLKVYYRGTWY